MIAQNPHSLLAAAYIRVSTEDQAEFSPDAQLREIKKYCEAKGLSILENHIYCESNSAKHAETRPKFMEMIAAAKSKPKPFDVVLVHKFDRFARNREDSVVYKSLLKRHGVKVTSVTEQLVDDKFSIILESMLEAMAEYYSLNLAEEVKKGMTEKAMRGQLQTPPPLGYTMEDGKLIPDAAQSETIKKIFNLYVYQNMTSSEIARYMNESNEFTKNGNRFQKRSIDYIINNPVYAGDIRWNPHFKTDYLYETPDGAIITKGAHTAIIDEKTYTLAAQKTPRPRAGAKTRTRKHSLSGVLKCARCGGDMYYCGNIFRCGNYLNKKCKFSQGVSVTKIENMVASKLPEYKSHSAFSEKLKAVYFDKELGIVDMLFK